MVAQQWRLGVLLRLRELQVLHKMHESRVAAETQKGLRTGLRGPGSSVTLLPRPLPTCALGGGGGGKGKYS